MNRGRELFDKHSPTRSTIPSATPSAQAASTLPLSSMILVRSFLPSARAGSVMPSCASSRRAKYSCARWTKLVPMFFPIRSLPSTYSPLAGTWTCRRQEPNPRSSTVSQPWGLPAARLGSHSLLMRRARASARVPASCSWTWS